MVDLLHMYDQIGIDVFARLREFNKARNMGRVRCQEVRHEAAGVPVILSRAAARRGGRLVRHRAWLRRRPCRSRCPCRRHGARDQLDTVVNGHDNAGHSAEALVGDLADIEATSAVIDAIRSLDVFVNSAGMARHSPATETAADDFDAVMNVNLRGAYFASQAVAKTMIADGRPGSIINISSQMAVVGGVDRAVYCASKHAVEGFTKSMAIEQIPHGSGSARLPDFHSHAADRADFLATGAGEVDRGEDPTGPCRRGHHGRGAVSCLGRLGARYRHRMIDGMDGGLMARDNVTSLDVARHAGVGQSAVSRVFTPGASVSQSMTDRVLAAADELGYRPNVLARSMITGKSRLIGLVVAYLDNQFYPEILEKLSTSCSSAAITCWFSAQQTAGDIDDVLEEILDYRVDGIVLASVAMSSVRPNGAMLPEFRWCCSTVPSRRTGSLPTSDNFAGGRALAEFLVAGGHRRIAISPGGRRPTQRDREAGFAGLAAHGHKLFARGVGDFGQRQRRRRRVRCFQLLNFPMPFSLPMIAWRSP